MINKDRVRTMTRLAIYEEGRSLRMTSEAWSRHS